MINDHIFWHYFINRVKSFYKMYNIFQKVIECFSYLNNVYDAGKTWLLQLYNAGFIVEALINSKAFI